MVGMGSRIGFAALLSLAFIPMAWPDSATFDLTGPPIGVKVERKGKTLPISQVPNLRPGDRLWVHPDFPDDQSARYLLVVAFLRGSTNPPPERWFTRAETWSKKVREEGIYVVVPEGAEQAAIFLAPETNGDFSTLRSAVRGRPGSFVRAVQDLDQASLDRSRLDTYLAALQGTARTDPTKVHDVSVLLARSLDVRLDEDCFKEAVSEQAACLAQKGDELILNDGHSQSMVGALTSGSSADLIGQLSATPQAGYGYYSPYVGAIVDMGRILDSLHTAQYQYIPALSVPQKDELELKLNNPPSFHNPKSVIVIALPAVRSEEPPPLRAADAKLDACIQKNPFVLPADGAPLVFSTQLAHNLALHVEMASGKSFELPVTPDASRGGFVVDRAAVASAKLELANGASLKGTLHGDWGFDPFTGPTFRLQYAKPVKWTIPSTDTSGLMAGSEHTLHLRSDDAACVSRVSLKDGKGREIKSSWKVDKADEVEVTIPAESAKTSGVFTMHVAQVSIKNEEEIPLHIYSEAAQLKQFTVIPGDARGILHGTHLDDVESIQLRGIRFTRESAAEAPAQPADELQMAAPSGSATASLNPNEKLTAQVKLMDGRSLDVSAVVESPRPRVSLLNKEVELGGASGSSAIHLSNPGELPEDGQLSFSIKTDLPATFPRNEKIEIATADDSFHVLLGIEDGGLTLQDSQTAVGHFDPAKSFGHSAFGPLRFRPVDERGVDGDWEPLATLVREPSLKELDCPDDPNLECTLKGTSLFLLDAVAADPRFAQSAVVPEGFIGATLAVPRPVNGTLYVKLRDDPSDVNTANLPPTPDRAQPPGLGAPSNLLVAPPPVPPQQVSTPQAAPPPEPVQPQ